MVKRLGLIALLASWPTWSAAVDLFGEDESEFLHPDEAFVLVMSASGPQRAQARFQIAEGYYLYRDKMRFVATDPAGEIDYELPDGAIKDDPLFGQVATYSGGLSVDLQLPAGAGETMTLQAHYQGCAERGVCYPPQVKTVALQWVSAEEVLLSVSDSSSVSPDMLLSRSDQIAADLSQTTLWWSFLAFLGFGLLLALTPCVLPMIPILAGVIAGATSTGRAFRLSLSYVLAMASTYAVLGVAIGLTGANLQAYMQDPWIIAAFVVILIAMALSMFGVYEMRFISVLNTRVHELSQRVGGGNYVGAVIMGALGALIASPCVSPPLVGALLHIAHEGGAVRGAVSLFSMGLGLGIPLLLFGVFEGRFLPRAGAWMTRVRSFFGILLLALSIWMLDRVWPGQLTLAAAGLLLIFTGVYMRALDTLDRQADRALRLGKAVGVVLLVYGAVFLVGGISGGTSVLRPLAPLMDSAAPEQELLAYRPIKTVEDLQQELAAATQPVLVDFYADWCVTCQELKTFTFPDPLVQQRMQHFIRLQVDVTDNDAADQELLASLDLFGPPAILFYTADGEELRAYRTVSYISADDFAEQLNEVLEFAQ